MIKTSRDRERAQMIRQLLTPHERTTISSALALAAEQYDKDKTACAETPRVAEAFDKQAKDARDLIEIIDL